MSLSASWLACFSRSDLAEPGLWGCQGEVFRLDSLLALVLVSRHSVRTFPGFGYDCLCLLLGFQQPLDPVLPRGNLHAGSSLALRRLEQDVGYAVQ